MLTAERRDEDSAVKDAEIENLLARVAAVFNVEDHQMLAALLARGIAGDTTSEATAEEIAHVEAHRRAAELARQVRAIDDRGSALFHYALLAPIVDFARVDEVLLVSGEAMPDVTAYFPGG